MPMVSSEDGDAGEQVHNHLDMPSFLHKANSQLRVLFSTKPFSTLPRCSPPVISRFSIAIGLLGVSHLPADADAEGRCPHSALLLHGMPQGCTLAFALVPLPRTRITQDIPLTLRQTPISGVVGTLAPLTSQPRPRTPRMVPAPRLRWTVTLAPARMRTASTY
ncbi:hypothetical protein B0H13DRAFT_2367128 [Mycena leptocephala]|nr:hypothetical protein B0H13DRAFT_2367128 [Mycena leptocephala]